LISDSGGDIAVSAVTTTELGYLDGVTSAIQTQIDSKQGTLSLTANRALISDSGGSVSVSPVTNTEVGYLDGVTSAIQTQIDSKQATITGAATTIDDADLTASRAVISNASGKVAVSAVTDTELGYLDGVTSAIQTQINSKQATITGAATTIDDANLTASRAVISNASGKVAVSAVTDTELGYLDGVTSAIQTQINSKIDGTSLNASNLDSGTVNDARLPSSISSDITGNAATATTAAALTGDITTSGDISLDIGGSVFIDSSDGVISFADDSQANAKIDFATSNTLKFFAGVISEEMRITGSGVNVINGLRVGDTTAPTDNDIYAAADIEAGGEFKLSGGAQDWTFEVDGSNRLVIQYNGTSLARIDTSGNLVVAGDVTAFGSL